MKNTYPVILTPDTEGYIVYIPDFDINTEGDTLTEAIEMARDAIGLMGIDLEDENKAIPAASDPASIKKSSDSDIISLVDIDFTEYRRKNDLRTVRRNVTLPMWLDTAAKEAKINVSSVLQRALKQELHIDR